MLEETKMDKKHINRSQQSRASAIDCKKNTDSSARPWPRNNKKREGTSAAPKNEPSRKNVVNRGRGQLDRRPRARDPANFSLGGTQNSRVEDDEEPEIGSVFVPGSKKQNLNHLLNFMYPSRGGPDRSPVFSVPRNNERRGQQRHQRVSYRHEHDLYLRAYCQFVVKEEGDYKANLLDPDVPVKWDLIEEIVVRSSGKSECPICLGTPAAGRVGICGHVYCWACILHYAATHEKQPPPCPVCTTGINVKDMKPTRIVQWDSPAEEVTMRLVRRLRGSTTVELAPPRGQNIETVTESIRPLNEINSAPFAKFFVANKQQVQEILDRERKEIKDQILAEIDTTEIVFLEQALDMLKTKEMNIAAQVELPKLEEVCDVPAIVYEKETEVAENKAKLDWFDVTEDGAACVDILQEQIADLDINVPQSSLNPDAPVFKQDSEEAEDFPLIECSLPDEQIDDNTTYTDVDKQNQAKYFYFYQAEDGQQVFLNSLNVRILYASWGALAAAPALIRGRVLHRETLPLSEQTRKHMPHTAHLPLHCSFDIVELDLQPPCVTEGALNSFNEELSRRARLRARHERDERRRERAHRRAAEGPPRPDFTSDLVFPAPAPYSPPEVMLEASPNNSAVATSSSGLSFAKMASTSGTWRVRKTVAPPSPPPDEEGTAPRALNLSDAIEAALHAAPLTNKKKKSKPKVLFSTGMPRAN